MTRRKPGVDIAVIAGLALLVVAAFALLPGRDRTRDLDASTIGTDGLAMWLRAEGISARAYDGFGRLRGGGLGLRVLPLYDAVPDQDRLSPITEPDLIFQQSERDAEMTILIAKLRQYPTLVILPKWRTGMRLLHAAHPDLLIGQNTLNAPAFAGLRAGGMVNISAGVATFRYAPLNAPTLTARIHAPQTLAASADCTPILGTPGAMLLGRCLFDTTKNRRNGKNLNRRYVSQPQDGYWLLTDPDLLNNHGLTQGDNAAIATAMIRNAAGGGDVIIDLTPDMWHLEDDDGVRRTREWSDLAPLFAPPFTALWAGLAALAALMIWRGGVRHGAPLPEGAGGPGAARAVAVDAAARLLRLSGHDGALLAAWAEQRLAGAAVALLGPHRKTTVDPGTQLTAWLARRDAARAQALATVIKAVRAAPPEMGPAGALRLMDDFEAQVEQVLHDAGRPSKRR